MFSKKLRLVTHVLCGIPKWISVGDKTMLVRRLATDTDPSRLTRLNKNKLRAANRKELEEFAREYGSYNLMMIHAVGTGPFLSIGGPRSYRVYVLKHGKVKQIDHILDWGISEGTRLIWVKEVNEEK